MVRSAIPSWFFVLVVVRLGRRFLLVHERKHGQLWYLPAGRVEPGETIVEAARRETREESGIDVIIEGVLRVEHTPHPEGSARVRVLLVARPLDDTPPRTTPDDESLGAAWVTLEEMEKLPLRGAEVLDLFRYVAAGAPVYPLDVLVPEATPFPKRFA